MADLELRGSGNNWRVYSDGKPVSREFLQITTATAALQGIERRLRREAAFNRACLCCGRKFASEGAHNRLCDYCRTRR